MTQDKVSGADKSGTRPVGAERQPDDKSDLCHEPVSKEQRRIESLFGKGDVEIQRQPCDRSALCHAPPGKKELHYIEIVLVDEDDDPVPGEEYCVVDGDGIERRGFLDERGFAREDGIQSAAPCRVTFPRLDRDAWSKEGDTPGA